MKSVHAEMTMEHAVVSQHQWIAQRNRCAFMADHTDGMTIRLEASFPTEEAPGMSVFCRDDAGAIFHTYSTYGRGVEVMMGAYGLMPHAQGPRRARRAVQDGVGAAPRFVRARARGERLRAARAACR